MKNKASALLKKITSVLGALAKAKSMAVKTKFSATKARLLMLSVMKNKKVLMDSLSQKIHGILGQQEEYGEDDGDRSKAIILYDAANRYQSSRSVAMAAQVEEEDENNKYPDLTHSLFSEEDDYDIDDAKLQAAGGSIIGMMRNSKDEEGEEFRLEEEIDQAADLFIQRFRKQIRLQKLESFKRLQEMLGRGT